jgi:hypothetical protein
LRHSTYGFVKSDALGADTDDMKVNLDRGKPRARCVRSIERVEGGWRATVVLTNRLGVILERHVRFASTQTDAAEAALNALSGRWVWSPY